MVEPLIVSDEALRVRLAFSGADLAPGLLDGEAEQVEQAFGFRFPPDYRRLLTIALPLGDRWPNWRDGDEDALRGRLAWPVEGILFDVEQNGFWHPDWQDRPQNKVEAVAAARAALSGVPPLVPVYGHRYLPTVPSESGNPVLSVMQTDIIYYGNDLLHWFDHEFQRHSVEREPRRVPFWSWFVEDDPSDSRQFW